MNGRGLALACVLAGSLLPATVTVAEDGWGGDLEIYAWLPIIEIEAGNGNKSEVTRDDILSDLDMAALWAARIRKGPWSLSSDFVYLDISAKTDVDLVPEIPEGSTLREAGFSAWIITPNIGYAILNDDRQKIELYAGARYFWIEADATIEFDPLSPGEPPRSETLSPSVSNWDGIAGVRGLHYLSDKWFIGYSVNAGTGESDFAWGAQTAFGYRYTNLDAMFGWRYLSYDVGSDTVIRELTINGPLAGVIWRW